MGFSRNKWFLARAPISGISGALSEGTKRFFPTPGKNKRGTGGAEPGV